MENQVFKKIPLKKWGFGVGGSHSEQVVDTGVYCFGIESSLLLGGEGEQRRSRGCAGETCGT